MKLVIGCDEAAYRLKETMKEYIIQLGHEVKDIGVYNEEPSLYPDTAQKLCACITDGSCERGILLCGTGIGMAITANKIPGIRAAVRCCAWEPESLRPNMQSCWRSAGWNVILRVVPVRKRWHASWRSNRNTEDKEVQQNAENHQ